MDDLISRQAAIDAHCELCGDRWRCDGYDICPDMEVFKLLPSVQPEKVCFAEIKVAGEELQRCVDRAVDRLKEEGQPEVIRCKDCKNQEKFFQKDGRRKDGAITFTGVPLRKDTLTFVLMMIIAHGQKGEKMTDYISREAAIEAIENTDWYHINHSGELVHGANGNDDTPLYKADDVYKAIDAVPAADVVERKTGKWIKTDKHDIYYQSGYECSICGVLTTCHGNYCPNCGARMER